MTGSPAAPCDLCGLEIAGQPFALATPQGAKQFCCEACRQIFSMLNENEEAGAAPAGDSRNQDGR